MALSPIYRLFQMSTKRKRLIPKTVARPAAELHSEGDDKRPLRGSYPRQRPFSLPTCYRILQQSRTS